MIENNKMSDLSGPYPNMSELSLDHQDIFKLIQTYLKLSKPTWTYLNTSHSAYVATATESKGAKIDDF